VLPLLLSVLPVLPPVLPVLPPVTPAMFVLLSAVPGPVLEWHGIFFFSLAFDDLLGASAWAETKGAACIFLRALWTSALDTLLASVRCVGILCSYHGIVFRLNLLEEPPDAVCKSSAHMGDPREKCADVSQDSYDDILTTPTTIHWLHFGRFHTHFIASCYESNKAAGTARLQRKTTARNEACGCH
jgi:hypothetical protein